MTQQTLVNHLFPEGSLDGGDIGGAKGKEGGEGRGDHQTRTDLAVEQRDVLHGHAHTGLEVKRVRCEDEKQIKGT